MRDTKLGLAYPVLRGHATSTQADTLHYVCTCLGLNMAEACYLKEYVLRNVGSSVEISVRDVHEMTRRNNDMHVGGYTLQGPPAHPVLGPTRLFGSFHGFCCNNSVVTIAFASAVLNLAVAARADALVWPLDDFAYGVSRTLSAAGGRSFAMPRRCW